MNTGNDWQFGINSGASFGMNSNEASLFRGNGFTTGLNGQYFAGPLGLGISAGFINSKLNTSAINQFIIERRFPQNGTISTTPAQNAFLMLGPSFRLGTKVQLLAGVKGGIFFNQGGGLIIGQQGALRPLYRFESGTKSLFPGFNGSVSFSYPLGNTSAIILSTDYLRSSSSVQLLDPQRGIDIPVEQKRNFQTVNAGISFVKTFSVKAKSDPGATGMQTNPYAAGVPSANTLKRKLGEKQKSWLPANFRTTGQNENNSNEEVSIIDPENKRVLKSKTKSNQSNDRTVQSCGPVTLKTTKPDGTVEEQTFSCPDDALQYQQKSGGMPNRISMNVTVPKQTQGATFGEKVNSGIQSAGSHIIAGRIIHTANENSIVSNRSQSQMATSGLQNNPGVHTNFYIRESGSGMTTGRRQYQPLFFDGLPQEDVCNPCLGQVKNNPLYEDKGGANNPLYKGRTIGNEQCDDKNSVFDVQLIDRNTGAVVATTKTNACGEYWFANVPDGNYSVAILAIWLSKKGYDYYKAQSDARMNIAGEVAVPNETWQHIIYGGGGGKVSVQDLSIVVADTDGDGQAEFFRAQGIFTDGSTQDFTQTSAARGGGTGKVSMQDFHFTLPASNQRSGGSGKVSVQDIHFTKRTGTFTATATFSDGTTQDVTEMVEMKQSGAVQQLNVQVGDVDGDGTPDLIWSPRSNIGVSAQSAKVNVQDLSFTKKTDHYIQTLPVLIGDVDSDGAPEFIVGQRGGTLGVGLPGMGVLSGRKFENGDIPNQDDYTNSVAGNPIGGLNIKGGKNPGGDSARMRTSTGNNDPFVPDFPLAIPGNPIGGISIKGGKNPGGNFQQRTTNSLGEFEFTNLEAGNYTFIVEATYVLNDITAIDLSEEGTGIYGKSGYVKITASQNSQSLKKGDFTPIKDNGPKITASQNSQSLRTAPSAPVKDNGPKVTVSQNSQSLRSSLTDLHQQLDALDLLLQQDDLPQNKAGVSTSRSNIRNLNTMIESMITDLENDNIPSVKQKMNSMNMQFLALQQSLQKLGGKYSSISNVLKTKHDTAKNSISNIR
jgi:hypothetical protein